MQHQADVIGEPAAYQAVWMLQPEGKVDNRAYAAAALRLWADVAFSEPVPALDAPAVSERPVPVNPAAGYRDRLT